MELVTSSLYVIAGSPLCGPALSQLSVDRDGRSYVFSPSSPGQPPCHRIGAPAIPAEPPHELPAGATTAVGHAQTRGRHPLPASAPARRSLLRGVAEGGAVHSDA